MDAELGSVEVELSLEVAELTSVETELGSVEAEFSRELGLIAAK